MRLYAESEELLYKMCNAPNDPIRENAIKYNPHGILQSISFWRKGMAAPTSKKILQQINDNTLKVSYKKFGVMKRIIGKLKADERRYAGLNLTNIGNPDKNTIEFRMANGTLDPEVIKQTIFLYASLINTAIQITDNPEQFEEKLEAFYNTNVTEEQKAHNFLNLIMEDPEDRQIYIERWQSVKDADVFAENHKKGFAQNRFKREEFKNIATRTPAPRVKAAYTYLKGLLFKERTIGGTSHDR